MNIIPRHVRIAVVGEPGCAAISTILSRQLDIPYLPLDKLDSWMGHDGSWDMLREEVARVLAGSRWVAVGNRDRVRELVLPHATMVVWLDYAGPLAAASTMARALGRAARRLWRDPAGALRALRRPRRRVRAERAERERRRAQFRGLLDARWVHLDTLGATRAWLRDVAR